MFEKCYLQALGSILGLELELRLIPIPELELKSPSCQGIGIGIENSGFVIGIEYIEK